MGKRISLPITGINRSVSNTYQSDSVSCHEIANLHKVKDMLKPMAVPVKSYTFKSTIHPDSLHIHQSDTTTIYVYLCTDGRAYYSLTRKNVSPTMIPGSPIFSLTSKITNLKNTLIITDYDNAVTYYSLFYNAAYDTMFTIPGICEIKFSAMPDTLPIKETVSGTDIYYDTNEDISTVAARRMDFASKESSGLIIGRFNGFILLRYAYELNDGTYILPSIPQLIWTGGMPPVGTTTFNDGNIDVAYKTGSATHHVGATIVRFTRLANFSAKGKISVNFKNTLTVSTGIEKYIKSISIFISSPLLRYSLSSDTSSDTIIDIVSSNNSHLANVNKIDDYINSAIYYKISDYTLAEIAALNNTTAALSIPDLTTITSYPTLPVDTLGWNNYSAKYSFVYNGRNFLGNIKTKLNAGLTKELLGVNSGEICSLVFIYAIKTDNGIFYAKNVVKTETTLKTISSFNAPHLFGYPDRRCFAVYVYQLTGTTYRYIGAKPLKPHLTDNYSYSLLVTYYSYVPYWSDLLYYAPINTHYNFGLSLTSLTPLVYPGESFVYDLNAVKASQVNYPFLIDANNSYQVGTGNIIAIASFSEPISQGQFGEYPILVFTDNGVYALELGSGDILISSIKPYKDDVIISDNILNINGSIIAITSKGITILSGGTSEDIVIDKVIIEGQNRLSGDANYAIFIDNASLVDLVDVFSDRPMLDYISGAKIGYNKLYNEIIVSNDAYLYSLVINVSTKEIYKSNIVYNSFASKYPDTIGLIGDDGYDIGIKSNVVTNGNIYSMLSNITFTITPQIDKYYWDIIYSQVTLQSVFTLYADLAKTNRYATATLTGVTGAADLVLYGTSTKIGEIEFFNTFSIVISGEYDNTPVSDFKILTGSIKNINTLVLETIYELTTGILTSYLKLNESVIMSGASNTLGGVQSISGTGLTASYQFNVSNYIYGDINNQLTIYTIKGVMSSNTYGGRLYYEIGYTIGNYWVRFYSDQAKLQQVAQMDLTSQNGNANIYSVNGSGITGTGRLQYIAPDADNYNIIDLGSFNLQSNGITYIEYTNGDDHAANTIEFSSLPTDIALLTNPINFNGFAKVNRVAVRGQLNQAETKYSGLYVYGSIDNETFTLIAGNQLLGKSKDIIVNVMRQSLKSLIALFCGNVDGDSYVTHIEIDYDDALENNKIR
jgi:hypothetical protein